MQPDENGIGEITRLDDDGDRTATHCVMEHDKAGGRARVAGHLSVSLAASAAWSGREQSASEMLSRRLQSGLIGHGIPKFDYLAWEPDSDETRTQSAIGRRSLILSILFLDVSDLHPSFSHGH
jgi:hypothetical protein